MSPLQSITIFQHYYLPIDTKDKRNKMFPSKKDNKYLTSRTSILLISMDAISNFDIFLDFVSFKASKIVNLIDEGEGCS